MQLSIWEKESFYAPRDIIIIGSGFAGLWSAYFLKKENPKLSIAIVDRGIIPTGASTRNAGFACFGSLTELVDDAQKNGEEQMLQLVELRYKGLQRIRKIFGEEGVDFDMCGGYELITEEKDPGKEALKEKMKWLNNLLKPVVKEKKVYSFENGKIEKFGFNGITQLIENKLEGSLHPGKLCQGLLSAVQEMGVTVLNAIEISGMEKISSKIVLFTNQGIRLSAEKVLICTNAFSRHLLPELDIVPARGQVLVTSAIEGLKFRGAFHYDEGFYYFRDLGDRVLLGGARNKAFEEEETAEMITTEKIQQELEHFLSHYILPGREYHITDRWSGIMGMGPEKMPVVKEISDQVFCAVRFGGIGVALAPIIGEKVAKIMEGE